MELTVAGSGTAAPDPERVCAGFFVAHGHTRVLLDCGSGVVHHLARFGLPWQRLTHLAISHFHTDHIADLPVLLFALKHGLRTPRSEPLTLIGPPGLGELVEGMARVFGEYVRDPGFPVDVQELEHGDVELAPGLALRAIRTPHTHASLGYRLNAGDAGLGYTGDTGYDDGLGDFFRGVDVLVAECSLPDEQAIDTHLTPGGLARLATAAAPGTLVVTHVYPQLEAGLAAALRAAGWAGPVVRARDGLRLRVG